MNLEQRNSELEAKLKDTDLPKAVEILIKDAKRRRRQVRVLAASIIIDILLTIGLGLISVRTQHIASTSESNKQAIMRNCETSNTARANNKQLWDYILSFPSQQPLTPDQQQQLVDFKAFVSKTFAPRNCNNL